MSTAKIIKYALNDKTELNLSYIPFINDGGLFIPTPESYALDDEVIVNLQLPKEKEAIVIKGKVVWVNPKHALHYVPQGIGIQFIGSDIQSIQKTIEANLDSSMDVGGYVYGINGSRVWGPDKNKR